VAHVGAAAEFYTSKLGFWLGFTEGDPPTFAGVNLGENVQIFLQQGTPAPQSCGVYFVVSDADALHRFHEAAGVPIRVPPADRAYGLRDYTVGDLHGHRLTFGHRLACQIDE
jgi:hypothetical protein